MFRIHQSTYYIDRYIYIHRKDEEVFVSYNYNVTGAPLWYQQAWLSHLRSVEWFPFEFSLQIKVLLQKREISKEAVKLVCYRTFHFFSYACFVYDFSYAESFDA